MADRKQQIRHEAYKIWEQEGRPLGQADRHWQLAEARLGSEEAAMGAVRATVVVEGETTRAFADAPKPRKKTAATSPAGDKSPK